MRGAGIVFSYHALVYTIWRNVGKVTLLLLAVLVFQAQSVPSTQLGCIQI